ncbi:MoaD/ThiS family protein [Parahaliea mediterranea]|uniref:MoaD/ThiS family protein n=1 Tax=Parahaliea mediterranea TaxID=651086 RepID=UPI000E2E4E6C|nr:MoaD/ThiS family protein [Parahaliea mediterranea]
MIDVILPAPLLRLSGAQNPVRLALQGPATQRALLAALEQRYPSLLGTMRDRHSGQRRAYVRFYACNQDISDQPPDAPLPPAVSAGHEPFIVLGALSGG